MSDCFMEHAVSSRRKAVQEIGYWSCSVLMVILGLMALMDISMLLQNLNIVILIEALILGGAAAGLYFLRNRFRTEYDYTFTNGILDFAVVYNSTSRKELGSLKVNHVDAFGKVSFPSFKRYVSMPGIRTDRWFLNRDSELYYFYFQKNGNKRLIVLEPREDLVECIRRYLPQGAWQKD